MMEIEENIILEANAVCCAIGDIDNAFGRVLKIGMNYKEKGLTPIYFFDNENMQIFVEIKETFGKKLN